SQHALDVGDDLVERQRRPEVIARRQIAANLLRRDRRDDRAPRDVGLEFGHDAPELIQRAYQCQSALSPSAGTRSREAIANGASPFRAMAKICGAPNRYGMIQRLQSP